MWNFLSEETRVAPSIFHFLKIASILMICLNLSSAVDALVCLV